MGLRPGRRHLDQAALKGASFDLPAGKLVADRDRRGDRNGAGCPVAKDPRTRDRSASAGTGST